MYPKDSNGNLKLRQINFADVTYGMQLNLTVYRGYGVKATPSVVVANSRTRKHRVMEGAAGITREAVMKAVAELRG